MLYYAEVAERVGFEPTHAVTRLTDFESAPWASWVPLRSKNNCIMQTCHLQA